MKIRQGFVSNSSSSSFTCDICGNTESGYDASPEELGFKRCHNDHTFCQGDEVDAPPLTDDEKKALLIESIGDWCKGDDRLKKIEEIKALTGEEFEDRWTDYEGDGIPPNRCPLCSFKKVSNSDRELYLLVRSGMTFKQVEDEIRIRFANFEEFQKFVHPPIVETPAVKKVEYDHDLGGPIESSIQ